MCAASIGERMLSMRRRKKARLQILDPASAATKANLEVSPSTINCCDVARGGPRADSSVSSCATSAHRIRWTHAGFVPWALCYCHLNMCTSCKAEAAQAPE